MSSARSPQLIFAARGGAGKSRCAPLLSPTEREALTAALLRDVLAAAAAYHRLLVTPTPALAAIGREAGATLIDEPEGASDLNAAYAHALTKVPKEAARALLPGDLGFLKSDDIEAALALLQRHDIVLASTNHGGTGAIFLAPGVSIAPAFGPGSFARHRAAAEAGGFDLAMLDRAGFTRDVDAPEDVLALAAERPQTHAGALAARITAAPQR